jgi:Transposase DDE domain group 1
VNARKEAAFFMTECNQTQLAFEAHFSRQVVAEFRGERLTTDGGGLLLRSVDRKIHLLPRVVSCFHDGRARQRIEHELSVLLGQRIYGLALGYEDLNDHEQLRHDPLLAVMAGQRELDQPLAGKSTLNRMELTPRDDAGEQRYHKISYSTALLDRLLVDFFWKLIPRRRTASCSTWM